MAENRSTSSVFMSASAPDDDDQLLSSPPGALPSSNYNSKERRQPSITPRKFRRFFTPRSRVSANPSAARRALRDLTALALNQSSTPSAGPVDVNGLPLHQNDGSEEAVLSPRLAKRRKTGHCTPETSPLKPSSMLLIDDVFTPVPASKAVAACSMLLSPLASSPIHMADEATSDVDELDDLEKAGPALGQPFFRPPLRKVVPLTHRGVSGQLLQRQLGTMPRAGHQNFAPSRRR